MTIVRLQPDGSYEPDPDYHPRDLVTVLDVYGHRHRVRAAHLGDERRLLPRFNQHGQRLCGKKHELSTHLHRDNIAPGPDAVLPPDEHPGWDRLDTALKGT